MGEIRRELINELLKKRVTYSDIKKHNLSEDELYTLYMTDFIDSKEFVYMYRQENPRAHLKSAYKQWSRELKKNAKFFVEGELDPFTQIVDYNAQYGVNREFLIARLHDRVIPTFLYYSSQGMYVRELLHYRDIMYEYSMSVVEAANLLDITPRHLWRLAKKRKIRIKNGTISVLEISNYLWSKISRECEILMRILPMKLENFVESWKHKTTTLDSQKRPEGQKSLTRLAKKDL